MEDKRNNSTSTKEVPNKETLEAFAEVDEMKIAGSGQHFEGSTADFLAWDPDFTKVTPEEKKRLEEIEAEMEAGIYFTEEEVFD